MKRARGGTAAGFAPPYADVYAAVMEAHLKTRGVSEPQLRASAVKRFKQAPARACAREIKRFLEGRLKDRGLTQAALAARVGVDPASVTRWMKDGNIRLGPLVLVLGELGCDVADLPLPLRRALAVEGYCAAATYVREQLERAAATEASRRGEPPPERFYFGPLDASGFWCLFHVLSRPDWERNRRANDPVGLADEAARAVAAARASGARRDDGLGDWLDAVDLSDPSSAVRAVRAVLAGWTTSFLVTLKLLSEVLSTAWEPWGPGVRP